ncbi:radical SAM domain-containing protein [Desulfosediminicola flagellatus]|uniref:radical SAM domain-containing protein n=1 Tax=Desulfosediminicola flagellatus TaxID=2569541 RepID=UPI001E535192|nr:radical SAM domain-containing protein [Desulfosediminicola flagellatus]
MNATASYSSDDVRVTINKHGARQYTRMSYPLHSGIFTEVETKNHILHFNLNNEIIRAKGKGKDWPHPHEWLKRNMGNDWIYYSTGGYTGVFEATGEYYLPNLPYKTNGMLGGNPFSNEPVDNLIQSWPETLSAILNNTPDLPIHVSDFLTNALTHTSQDLSQKADRLFSICGGRSTVLPPDARHVDYNVIPITISTGCLYKCRFCEVKNKLPFAAKSNKEITSQISSLKNIYDKDLLNYNAVFLGEHDALQTGPQIIVDTLSLAYEQFHFNQSFVSGCKAFLFGSVTSLMNTPDTFFKDLQQLPFEVYINIGLESADQATLDLLGKPITTQMVTDAFMRIQDINDRFSKTEITANFVIDDDLPATHLPAFLELVRESLPRVKPKGCVYLSPLKFGQPSRSKTFGFNRLKVLSRVPTFLYIIQRL